MRGAFSPAAGQWRRFVTGGRESECDRLAYQCRRSPRPKSFAAGPNMGVHRVARDPKGARYFLRGPARSEEAYDVTLPWREPGSLSEWGSRWLREAPPLSHSLSLVLPWPGPRVLCAQGGDRSTMSSRRTGFRRGHSALAESCHRNIAVLGPQGWRITAPSAGHHRTDRGAAPAPTHHKFAIWRRNRRAIACTQRWPGRWPHASPL